MKDWHLQQAKKGFQALEDMFVTGVMEKEKFLHVKDGCVYSYLSLIYKIGETEEAFLARCAATDERKYPVSFCDLIDEDDWLARGHDYESTEHDEQLALTWDETIQEYIDDLDEDDVLVSIDYHM